MDIYSILLYNIDEINKSRYAARFVQFTPCSSTTSELFPLLSAQLESGLQLRLEQGAHEEF